MEVESSCPGLQELGSPNAELAKCGPSTGPVDYQECTEKDARQPCGQQVGAWTVCKAAAFKAFGLWTTL